MFSQFVIGSALLSSSVAALLLPSAIASTADALITPGPQNEFVNRQNDQRYMGWVANSKSVWSTELCDFGTLISLIV
jgi:hypothetical protein